MCSEARQLANARNAQMSTGPRTPAGKARSSRNALTHGLSALVHLTPATQAAYDTLLPVWTAEVQPTTAGEAFLVHNLALITAQQAACATTQTARLLKQRRKQAQAQARTEAQIEAEADAKRPARSYTAYSIDAHGRYKDLASRLLDRPEGAVDDFAATRRGRDYLRFLIRDFFASLLTAGYTQWSRQYAPFFLALDGGRRIHFSFYDPTIPDEAPLAEALAAINNGQSTPEQQLLLRARLVAIDKRLQLDSPDPISSPSTDPPARDLPAPLPEIDLSRKGVRLLQHSGRLHGQLQQTLRTLLQLRRNRADAPPTDEPEPSSPSAPESIPPTTDDPPSPQPPSAPSPPPQWIQNQLPTSPQNVVSDISESTCDRQYSAQNEPNATPHPAGDLCSNPSHAWPHDPASPPET